MYKRQTDLYELKAAILAAKENCNLPVFTSMSFESRGRTFTGCTVESYAVTAAGLGADAIGINCSLGPAEILPFAQRLCRSVPAELPVFVKPNAGLPNPDGSYNLDANGFAEQMREYAATGISMVGGCCGTTPEYIAKLKETFNPLTPCLLYTSRSSSSSKSKSRSSSSRSSTTYRASSGKSGQSSSSRNKAQASRRAQRRAETPNLARSILLAGLGLLCVALSLIHI